MADLDTDTDADVITKTGLLRDEAALFRLSEEVEVHNDAAAEEPARLAAAVYIKDDTMTVREVEPVAGPFEGFPDERLMESEKVSALDKVARSSDGRRVTATSIVLTTRPAD